MRSASRTTWSGTCCSRSLAWVPVRALEPVRKVTFFARPAGVYGRARVCADKGYDFDAVRSALSAPGFVSHILSLSQERTALKLPGYRARRWIVEAARPWLNRFRRFLVRWEKTALNYPALLHLACAVIV